MAKYKYRCGSEVDGKPPKHRTRSRRMCKSITFRAEEKLSKLENTIKMQQKELKQYKSGNRRLEQKYEKAFKHILKLSKFQQKSISKTRVNSNRSHSNECTKSPSFKTTEEFTSLKNIPIPPKKILSSSHTTKDLSIKPGKRKMIIEDKIRSLQDSVDKAMIDFKKIEKKEKAMLSKKVKQIKDNYQDKLKDLEARYKKQKRKLEEQQIQEIQKEKDVTKLRLEREVENLCKYLQFRDTSKNGTTCMSNDSILGNNLKDSMLRQSMTGSNYSEIKVMNGSQIIDNDKASIYARRASSSVDRNEMIADKENIMINNQLVNNASAFDKQHTVSTKLGETFGGFTTLAQNSKSFQMRNNVSQQPMILGSLDTKNQQNLMITSPNSLLNCCNTNHISNISPTLVSKSPIHNIITKAFKNEVNSSESDSDESITRYVAISPRIRNVIGNSLKTNYFNKFTSNPVIRSCYNFDTNLGTSSSTGYLDNKFEELNTDRGLTLCKKNSSSDSDNSDVEMSIIEKGIQMSLEQVTNRLKSYNTNS